MLVGNLIVVLLMGFDKLFKSKLKKGVINDKCDKKTKAR
jgi:hypothetical protein